MPRGDFLEGRLLARIKESSLSLSVHYPPARPAATGASPGAAPLSPLTGPRPTTSVYPGPETPSKPSKTLKCLWYPSTDFLPHRLRFTPNGTGWAANADAFAQVMVSEAALDPDDPFGDTVFTACERVEYQGHRYRVLAVQPVSAGHRQPATMYVWLVGAQKQ